MAMRPMRNPFISFFFIFLFLFESTALAAPYRTLTLGPDGRMVLTQTAYEPESMIRLDTNRPEDFFVEDETGRIYIADTGNARILVRESDGNERTIGEGILSAPSGVFVKKDVLYVADGGNQKVYTFDKETGKLLQEIGRPTEPIYGKNTGFLPRKVAVDLRGNIYVVSEGSINGVLQFNHSGNFIGFIGANRTDVSLMMLLQRMIFTEEQRERLFKTTPPSPTNIVTDEQGLLYTLTTGIQREIIKKLNVLGKNILQDRIAASDTMLDLDVDKDGNIYAIDQEGFIVVYDTFANLLFLFGGPDSGRELAGFVKAPSAIDVSRDGKYIYALDKERNLLNRYEITPFASEVLVGVKQYKEGFYQQSKENWNRILRMNSFFILSYQALAKAYFKEGNYKAALDSFKLAEDRQGYSDAFWQIRNDWLQAHGGTLIFILILLFILFPFLRWIERKTGIFTPLQKGWLRFKNLRGVREILFSLYFLRHPIDAFYEMKENRRATLFSATILYLWFFVLQVLLLYVTGYIFTTGNPAHVNITSLLLSGAVPFILWIINHYLIATINDGEGKFSEVYIGTIYALTPYLVFALPIAIVSNFLTYNEAFIYQYSMGAVYVWSGLLLFLMVKEVHNYTIRETVKNILITFFSITMMVLFIFILTLLFNQEVDFIRTIIQEVRARV
ncbi:NHL repeat containing protein [[Clostridium] ultunense Esp]|nr:NHL repeat containing protein [[Clostridium] ultunense Esp]